MDEASATGVNAARQKGHTKRLVVRNTLESTNDVCPLKVLSHVVSIVGKVSE